MVVVPKPSGHMSICIDLKRLNEGVQREFHPLPHVEEVLAQLHRCLQSWMPTVGFGRSHLPESRVINYIYHSIQKILF